VGHSSFILAFLFVASAAALGVVSPDAALAQGPPERPGGVYQRRASDWHGGRGHRDFHGKDRRHFRQPVAPNIQSRWFTRPYPYHLDFYKMKYGGSYAPYFGNLYGPPQVVTAPPYYGPYYGGWGLGAGGWPEEGYGGGPFGQPGFPMGPTYEAPVEEASPSGQPKAEAEGERLPAPSQ
jgi:hypothetical protein